MHIRLLGYIRLTVLLLASLVPATSTVRAAEASQHVVLQLKWRHAFQFAGYYAALEQGYYRDAGLDVEFVELTGELSPTELLLQGKADYAVASADVVIHRASGAPVVALAAIYQHSPYAFLVREDSGMTRVEDFAGKRIMMGSGQQSADLLAALRRAGLSEADYMRIPTNYDFRSLITGEVDVYDAYVTDQGQTMEEAGVEGRYILPTHYGVDFYGDVLVTTEQKLQEQPEQVAAFREASLRGWKYALNHPDELISLILTRYNTQGLSKTHLEYEAITSREMIQPLLLELGYMNAERWEHIRDIFVEEGLIAPRRSLDGFIYRQEARDPAWLRWAVNHERLLLTGVAATLLLALSLVLLQTRRMSLHRTSALAERERYLKAVIDATPVCVKTLDADGRLTSMNPAGLAMLDVEHYGQIDGMDASQIVDAEYRARYRDLVRRAHAGDSGSLLFSAKGLRGRPVWLESYAVPFRNEASGSTNVLVVTLDITSRKQMEIALQEQHDHLQKLLNSINGISWEFDLAADRFTYVSPNSQRILGYSIAEWTNMDSWLAMIEPEDRESARFYCMSQTAAGQDHLFEYRMRKKNGQVISVLDVVRVIKDAENRPIRIAGFMIDQTDLKQARAAMRESEERYRSMFDGAPEGVWLVDETLQTLQVNRQLCALLGRDSDELLRQPLPDFIADPAWKSELLAAIKGTGNRQQLEVDLRHRDGRLIPVLLSLTRLPVAGDGRATTVAFVTDLTQKKAAELAVRRAQRMDAIGQLTGGIAHDFNNILGIILGNLELLETALPSSVSVRTRLDNLRNVTRRAINLTQQLLGFARTEVHNRIVSDADVLIDSMRARVQREIPAGVEVRYHLARHLWPTEIDPGEFQDSLMQLIHNACDAMNGTGQIDIITRNVTLTAAEIPRYPGLSPGDHVQLQVSDSGRGIQHEHLDHIFEPFFTTKSYGKGAGLGLSMVFGFVQRSEGRIDVQSEPGKGTCFTLMLPRALVELPASAGMDDIPVAACSAGKETILVVDDEVGLLELAQHRLGRLGYRVLTADNGETALQLLESNPGIDLLLTDVVMPGLLNGYALAERALQRRPELKVLHTSGYTDEALATTYAAHFTANLLKKPYTLQDLATRVRAALDC